MIAAERVVEAILIADRTMRPSKDLPATVKRAVAEPWEFAS